MKKTLVDEARGILGEHYYYESSKGLISLIYPCEANNVTYEIYCIKGDLFYDVFRYEKLEDAEHIIKELLNEFIFGR